MFNQVDVLLYLACLHNDTVQAESLLAKGANPNAKLLFNWTPLHGAASGGNDQAAKIMIEAGAEIDAMDEIKPGITMNTIRKDGTPEMDRLREVDWSITRNCLSSWNCCGTPLHVAAGKGAYKVLMLLLGHGADVNLKNGYGQTSLHLGATDPSKTIVEVLLENGADLKAKDDRGRTPLDAAVDCELPETIQFLVSRGCSLRMEEKPPASTVKTFEDLDNFLRVLFDEKFVYPLVRNIPPYQGSLEEYLRSLWSAILERRDQVVSYSLMAELFQAALAGADPGTGANL
jgi:ankyrin repeat protein